MRSSEARLSGPQIGPVSGHPVVRRRRARSQPNLPGSCRRGAGRSPYFHKTPQFPPHQFGQLAPASLPEARNYQRTRRVEDLVSEQTEMVGQASLAKHRSHDQMPVLHLAFTKRGPVPVGVLAKVRICLLYTSSSQCLSLRQRPVAHERIFWLGEVRGEHQYSQWRSARAAMCGARRLLSLIHI